ncbi:MAG TPA: DNA translocase FtsK 4TM domain-containing protein, partial [Phycisphaerae bacterium]|nr:DNA translocase FtsK 4TM domain-containing protein [Phycisphaerae bacterium]
MAKKDKKNSATPGDDGPPRGRRFWRYCFVLLLAGVTALAWLSMLSFHPNDPPSPNVESPREPVNRAGIVGAYLAFEMHYWLGGGAYMVLLFATVAALVLMFGGRVTHLPWRIFGVAMLTTATSAALFLHSPQPGMGPANSPAGVLGIGVGEFLTAKFGPVGGWLIA